jgi:hypothetical protein
LTSTVIGPDVDLVSRIKALVKSLNLLLVVSDDFVRACGGIAALARPAQAACLETPHELSMLPDTKAA